MPVRPQQFGKRLRRRHAIEEPERMGELAARLAGSEREAVGRGERVDEPDDILLVDELPVLADLEELRQRERIRFVHAVTVNVTGSLHRATEDDTGQHERHELHLRHVGIRVRQTKLVIAALLRLLIGICPVEHGGLGELALRNCLERRSRQVDLHLVVDTAERDFRLQRLHALMRLIENDGIPLRLRHPAEFVVLAAEIDSSFQVLQRHERDTPVRPARRHDTVVFARRHDARLARNRLAIAHECHIRFRCDELTVVVTPRLPDRRAVRQDEDVTEHARHLQQDAQDECIHRRRLAETSLRVDEHSDDAIGVGSALLLNLGPQELDAPLLLGAEDERDLLCRRGFDDAVVESELVEARPRLLRGNREPLRPRLALVPEALEIGMELVIVERSHDALAVRLELRRRMPM